MENVSSRAPPVTSVAETNIGRISAHEVSIAGTPQPARQNELPLSPGIVDRKSPKACFADIYQSLSLPLDQPSSQGCDQSSVIMLTAGNLIYHPAARLMHARASIKRMAITGGTQSLSLMRFRFLRSCPGANLIDSSRVSRR